MSRSKLVVDRIRELIPITDVLAHYGYKVRDGGYREQQFSCDLHGSGRDLKPSARVYPESSSWYCVFTGDPVLTDTGWRPLGSCVDPKPVLDGTGAWAAPLVYLDKGTKPCVRVETPAGYQVTLTRDHLVDTANRGWVPAGELVPGDQLIIPCPKQIAFSKVQDLPCSVQDLNARHCRKPLNLPSCWSQDLGEFLGYIFGDGSITHRKESRSSIVTLSAFAEDAEGARAIFQKASVWAGGRGGETHCTSFTRVNGRVYAQNQRVFSITNRDFALFLERLGLDKQGPCRERRLPLSLWSAPEEAIRGFLRGLYATDGSVIRAKDRKGIRVEVSSVSVGFLRDVQLLLLQYGIHSRLLYPAKTRPRSTHALQLATGLDILAFRAAIGIANPRKQGYLDAFCYNPRGARPFKALVRSVIPVGDLPVADLSMPGDPTFVVGGIKVHNCFSCGRTRDAIETVKEKENLSFWDAVRVLERRYGLEPLPAEAGYEYDDPTQAMQDGMLALDPVKTFADDSKRLRALLDGVTSPPCALSMDEALTLWETFDMIQFKVLGPKGTGGEWSEQRGRGVLDALRQRVLLRLGRN